MANSQDIEARLCAYIEGDLDAAERMEIERHLDQHPKHRQMIQDLIRTRGLMVNLPRAAAPSELGDGLRGQLERSMLLGQSDPSHDPWRRQARKLPQLIALAAVLAVSIGLGSVIYYLLHASIRPSPIVAVATPVVQPPPVVSDAPVPIPLVAPPVTQPARMVAIAPASTQPASTQPVILAVAKPTTMPAAVAVAIAPQTQPATQPTDASAQMVIIFTSDAAADSPVSSPTTLPVAGTDWRQ